jgi:TolB protein
MLKAIRFSKEIFKALNAGFVIMTLSWSLVPWQESPPSSQPKVEAQDLKAQLNRIIVRPGSGATMAIPEFSSLTPQSSDQAADAGRMLFNDLDFAGVVNIISKSLYPQAKTNDPTQVDFSVWRQDPIRADYLALGTAMTASNETILEIYLYDVQAGSSLLANRYRGMPDQTRTLAHRIADDIVKLLTGTEGISTSKLAFTSSKSGHREIYIMDYDGYDVRQFTFERSMTLFPNWSPDGKKIAYLSYQGQRPHIEIRSVTDGLPLGSFQFSQGTVSSPVFSPSGDQLAFCSSKDSNSMQLYAADLRTQRIRQLTNTRSIIHTSPRWNPRTGREIAFISNQSGSPQIYIIDADGGNPHRLLTLGGMADSPAWSPDGRYIAFAWQPPEASRYDIFIMDIATQQIVQLTNGPGNNESPAWSPDGRHLAFQSNRTGRFEVYIMHIDGTSVRQVTGSGGTSPAWWR